MFPERRYIGYEFGSTTFATTARVTSPPRETSPPVSFGGREFPIEIPLHIECVAQFGEGVELAPLVRRLKSFPNKRAWSAYLRRALVPLAEADVTLLRTVLEPVCHAYADAAPSYAREAGVHA
jgi:hypothetical protein